MTDAIKGCVPRFSARRGGPRDRPEVRLPSVGARVRPLVGLPVTKATGIGRSGAGQLRVGAKNPAWKGEDAANGSKRDRARRRFAVDRPCERCGSEVNRERHHIDGDPGNNEASNIQILCRSCHMAVDGRDNAALTRCSKGHDFTPANTWFDKNGWRHCRACRAANARAFRRRRRATAQ